MARLNILKSHQLLHKKLSNDIIDGYSGTIWAIFVDVIALKIWAILDAGGTAPFRKPLFIGLFR